MRATMFHLFRKYLSWKIEIQVPAIERRAMATVASK